MVSHDREGASKPHGEGVRLEDRRKQREPGRSARGIETWQQLRDHLATCWLVPVGTAPARSGGPARSTREAREVTKLI